MSENQLQPVTMEIERADDESIVEMLSGHADRYVYQVHGRDALTLPGLLAAANAKGGIRSEYVTEFETDEYYRVIFNATDTVTGSVRAGTATQNKRFDNGGIDDFAYEKAFSKAQRNAIKQLLPQDVLLEAIRKFKGGQQSHKPAPAKRKTREPALDLFDKLKPKLEEIAIDVEDFWSWVKSEYNVSSSDEMRDNQWASLRARLSGALNTDDAFQALVEELSNHTANQS